MGVFMLNVVRAAAFFICISGFSASSAGATTYNYVGNALDVFIPCCSSAAGMTGSVTFDFNTFDFSGTVYVSSGHVAALQLNGQNKGYYQYGYFDLDGGAITNWALQSPEYGSSSFGFDGDYFSTGVFCGSPLCYLAYNHDPGVWTPVDLAPVPSPIVGAGLPGLFVAVAGFIGWRRSRRAIAA